MIKAMNITGQVLFCDDIRKEDNGKSILIGVYTDEMQPSTLPQHLTLSFYARLNGFPVGEHTLTGNVFINDKIHQTANLTLKVGAADRPVNIMFFGVPLYLEKAGAISLEIICLETGASFRDSLPVRDPILPAIYEPITK